MQFAMTNQGCVGPGQKKGSYYMHETPLAPSYPEVIRGSVAPSANTGGNVPPCIHPRDNLRLARVHRVERRSLLCSHKLSRTLCLCEYRGERRSSLYSLNGAHEPCSLHSSRRASVQCQEDCSFRDYLFRYVVLWHALTYFDTHWHTLTHLDTL